MNLEPRTVRVGVLRPGGGYTVSDLPMEIYVARVLAGESLRDSQPAALEALAITIRTFALANLARHRADGFDLCDQTHCQVLRAAVAATERAAQATAGRVLLRDGAPASVYYSASCGGRTQHLTMCLGAEIEAVRTMTPAIGERERPDRDRERVERCRLTVA